MQIILTEEEYSALEGRVSIKTAEQVKAFRHALGVGLTRITEHGFRGVGDEIVPLRSLIKLINTSADEAFK